MACKFTKNVAWLEPFYEVAKDLLPKNKLEKVRGFKVPLGKDNQTLAACYSEEGKYQVTISLWIESDSIEKGKVVSRKPRYIEDMLMVFAHELAHVAQPHSVPAQKYHTLQHWELTLRILNRFTKVLRKKGIKDHQKRKCMILGKKA